MTKSVTVIIPCYNYGNSIRKAVRSVIAQTYPQVEIIVVNDGSTDTLTLRALEELKSENITILHQENRGPSAARNAGAAIAKGDYIMFLDNDDTIHPRTIELLSEALENHSECDYVYSSVYYHGQIPEYFVWEPQHFNAYDLIWANHPTLSSLIKRAVHEKVNGFSENLVYGMEDWEYWIKLSKHGYRGKMIDLPLYLYWQHGRTHTAIARENYRFTFNAIIENNPEVYNPHYISETKRQWRPVVTIIAYDAGLSTSILSSLLRQTIPDKQIIIVTPDPGRLQHSNSYCKEGITFIHRGIKTLAESFNEAFTSARGEFVFLLQNAGFADATSLENAVWRKIFDRNNAWHFYMAHQSKAGQPFPGLPAEVHQVTGALMETSLLRFSGGFAEGLSFHHSFQDLLLRLESSHISGLFVDNPVLVTACVKQSGPIAAFERYPQLFGYSPRLDLLLKKPLETAHRNDGQHPEYRSLKQLFHSELGAPWNVSEGNQRMTSPSLINPASSTKNVLYCIPFMARGGAEKVDIDVLAALKRDGYRITLVTDIASEHPWKPKFAELADEIYHADRITNNKQQQVKFLEYLLISRNVSLLFIRSSDAGYRLAALLNKEIKSTIATVDLLHAYDVDHEDWVDISAPYDPYIDERVVITRDLQEYLVATYDISRRKIRVIMNGLDTSLYSGSANAGRLREKLQLKAEIKIVGFIGRLCNEKGLFKWLETAAELNTRESQFHFVVAGDGPLKGELQDRAQALQINNISFIGWQEKVHETVTGFDLMLMTSRAEGLPLVIMEALCSGVPVVAPDIGGIREILTNDFSGLMAVDAVPKAYAEKIIQLLDMQESNKELLRAETIRFVQQTFDTRVCQQKYLDTITNLVASRHTANKTKAIITHLIAEPFIAKDYRIAPIISEYQDLAEYYLSGQHWQQKGFNNSEHIQLSNHPVVNRNDRDQVIAHWYLNQYEVLPLWFKRLGHIVKVLYGKRSWRSLFDDAAKGYDTTLSVQQWYNHEYEVLPTWFKRVGNIIKRIQGHRTSAKVGFPGEI